MPIDSLRRGMWYGVIVWFSLACGVHWLLHGCRWHGDRPDYPMSTDVGLGGLVMAAIAMGLVVILQPNDMPNNKFAISTAALTCVLAGAHGIFKGEWEGKNRRVWRLGLHAIYNCGVAASISWCVTAAWVKCLELANAFKISSPMENQPIVETMLGVDDPRELLHWVIPSLLTAPLIEEIVFRGFLYKFLGARAPRPVAAIVSAIIFSALHSNVMVAVPMFVLGLCLVKIYESNGTILATILVHSLFNAINLVSIGSQLR